MTTAKLSAILLIMDEITKELQKIKDQISISNGYADDVRKELKHSSTNSETIPRNSKDISWIGDSISNRDPNMAY